MKLYELPKGAKIYESLATEVGKVYNPQAEDDPVIFDHPDGLYSYCYLQSNPEIVAHISRLAELVKYKDGWKLKGESHTDQGKD
jgi:hypothetical protein